MDLTPIEEAFFDPRPKYKKHIAIQEPVLEKEEVLVPENTRCIKENYHPSPSYEASYYGLTCCSCKKINWFNVIVILLLLYLVFKKSD
jgi:hypothetical protein